MNTNSKPLGNRMSLQDTAVDATVSSIASKWGMGGGTMASIFGWFTSNAAAVLIGILVTVLGFLINYYFQRRRDRRETEQIEFKRELQLAEERRRKELHEAQLAAIRERGL
jgi:4-hydroxybenzoate polyprenyltransferase